jgi:hypothetical protein
MTQDYKCINKHNSYLRIGLQCFLDVLIGRILTNSIRQVLEVCHLPIKLLAKLFITNHNNIYHSEMIKIGGLNTRVLYPLSLPNKY